jgi:hypothetical protein
MKMPKSVGGWISLTFKLIGVTVAASPAISAVQTAISSGNFNQFGADVLYNYTGYNINTRAFAPAQLGAGIAAVGGGVALTKVGTFLGKMVH